jgi:hypothetical protein
MNEASSSLSTYLGDLYALKEDEILQRHLKTRFAYVGGTRFFWWQTGHRIRRLLRTYSQALALAM